jgi:hypothetical protein
MQFWVYFPSILAVNFLKRPLLFLNFELFESLLLHLDILFSEACDFVHQLFYFVFILEILRIELKLGCLVRVGV